MIGKTECYGDIPDRSPHRISGQNEKLMLIPYQPQSREKTMVPRQKLKERISHGVHEDSKREACYVVEKCTL